jgi:acetyl-CoA carboxylase biotin carboxylase subunit
VDSHIQGGATVPPYYDSLLGKLIVRGGDRIEALNKLRHALANLEITGVVTNVPMHAELVCNAEFAHGSVNTAFLERFLENRNAAAV